VTQNTLTTDLAWRRELWTVAPQYTFATIRTASETGAATAAPAEASTTVHALGADGALDVTRRTTLGAGYQLTLADFEPGDAFVGHRGRARVARALDPVTDASVRGGIIHRDFRAGTDVSIYRGDLGIRRDVSPRYSVEARAGYAVFDPATGESEDMVEFLLRGTYVGRTLRVTTRSGQSFQETFLEAENVGVTRTRESVVDVRYEATQRLALVVRGQLAENRFLQQRQQQQAAAPAGRRELLMGGGLGLDVRLTRRLSLGVDYDYTRVDSSVRGLDYAQNRVRVGLTAIYD
jgi:hypothetical protein